MSEPPAEYLSRTFVCERCGRTIEPSTDEALALLAMERHFGLAPEKASLLCEECQREERVQ